MEIQALESLPQSNQNIIDTCNSIDLFQKALNYHVMGANVIAIGGKDKDNNFGKMPLGQWKKWQSRRQQPDDVKKIFSAAYHGIGIICGISDWRSIDFDKCVSEECVFHLLEILNLPKNYVWVTRSGSGRGYHTWFRSNDPIPRILQAKKNIGIIHLNARSKDFDHLELRWENCYTIVPPSLHPSGKNYIFKNSWPTEAPSIVDIKSVIKALLELTDLAENYQVKISDEQNKLCKKNNFDRKTIEKIKSSFDMKKYMTIHFGGDFIVESRDNIRVKNNGGLIFLEEEKIWYCFIDGMSGDCIDLVGYKLFGTAWDSYNKDMFIEALSAAAVHAKVKLEPVQKGIKQPERLTESEVLDLLDKSQNEIPLYPSQDFKNNKIWYCLKTSKDLLVINSERETFFYKELEFYNYKAQSKPQDSSLQPNTVKKFLEEKTKTANAISEEQSAYKLFYRIKHFLERFIFFYYPQQSTVLAIWIMGTYIFSVFQYYPYIHIQAEKQSGKTLLMEVMSKITFNSEMTSNTSVAVLYRTIQANRSTLFIDEAESFRSEDKEFKRAMISILNSGFKYDGKASRSENNNSKGWDLKYYSAYSPKCFASINDIDDVLKDRTIPIKMKRKTKKEVTERLKPTQENQSLISHIQQDCYLFGLYYGKKIHERYQNFELGESWAEFLTNRELDIWECLIIIGKIIDEAGGINSKVVNCVDNLRDYALNSSKLRKEYDHQDNETSKLVKILTEMIEEEKIKPYESVNEGKYYRRNDVWNVFKRYSKDLFPEKNSRDKMVRLFNSKLELKLGKSVPIGKGKDKLYYIENGMLEDLKARYL